MTVLTPGKVFQSKTPTVLVENQLAVGDHKFQLTVVDTAQLESKAVELVVKVVERRTGPSPPPVIVERPPVDPVILPPSPGPPPVIVERPPIDPVVLQPAPNTTDPTTLTTPVTPIRPNR